MKLIKGEKIYTGSGSGSSRPSGRSTKNEGFVNPRTLGRRESLGLWTFELVCFVVSVSSLIGTETVPMAFVSLSDQNICSHHRRPSSLRRQTTARVAFQHHPQQFHRILHVPDQVSFHGTRGRVH